MPTLTSIVRYPVKGLTADYLDHINVEKNRWLPLDRAWAIENGGGVFDAQKPVHMKKKHFLMLAGQSALAGIECRFIEHEHKLRVTRKDEEPIEVFLDDPSTQGELFAHLEALLGDDIRGSLRIIRAPDQAMTDIPEAQLSLINAATVRDIASKTGLDISPDRFRGNLVIDGFDAGAELDWVGRNIRIGAVEAKVEARIRRCAATSVNLKTAVPDTDMPAALFEHYGHMDCGVYITVMNSDQITTGDPVELSN
ncbi:MAG: MOSC domain-containing protein [Maricaulis sp.]|nr:MOSC domain-containing protein [Maricaulis sp.]